jgi:hypothetical protein
MNTSKPKDLYIVVEGLNAGVGLNSTAFDFAQSAAGEDFEHIFLTWNARPYWVHNVNDTLPVIKHQINYKSYLLHLITFPAAIPKDFDLTDLQFPFPIDGLILTLDISSFGAFWDKTNSKDYFPFNAIERGGARWIRIPDIPCVLIATSLEPPLISIEQANQAFGLSPKIPTLFYPGKTRDTSAFYFFLTFAQDFVQAVFAELIKQIETADS